ncbi:MAG: pectin esterase, partial [Prevotella sp.]|nr:pectin esterase [Prevotella sp.]
MKKLISIICVLMGVMSIQAKDKYDNPDTLVVSRDGTGQFRNISEAIEVCRAFMDYHKVIFVKKGTYKEKLPIPQWRT